MTREGKAYTLPSKAWLAELADIADIRPDSLRPDHAEYFYIEVVSLLRGHWRNADQHTPNPAVLDAQKKIIAAHHAIYNLSERERECLDQSYVVSKSPLPFGRITVELWDIVSWVMIFALVEMTGKDPGPSYSKRRGPGQPMHTAQNFPFHRLVGNLLYLVARYSGRLSFDAKAGGSGSLLKALNHLRPVLPPGLVPKSLPLKTIERIKSKNSFRRPTTDTYPPPRIF